LLKALEDQSRKTQEKNVQYVLGNQAEEKLRTTHYNKMMDRAKPDIQGSDGYPRISQPSDEEQKQLNKRVCDQTAAELN